MAVVAYTSAAPNPTVDPRVDATVSQANLVGYQAQLYGGGLDDGDLSPKLTFAWQIIENPPGSTAKFQDTGNLTSTLQNPKIIDVNVWENIRVFLVVTSQDTGSISEADIYKAPDSAFVGVRVTSTVAAIQKPAPSERNWFVALRTIIQKIEDIAAANAAFALPASVQQLLNGGYAWFNNLSQHKHYGSQVDVATANAQGVSILSDAPVDALNPKTLNVDRAPLTAHLGGTPTANGYLPGIVQPPVVVVGTKRAHVAFYTDVDVVVDRWGVALSDGGSAAGSYQFKLYVGTAANWAAGAPTEVANSLVSGTAGADNVPLHMVSGAVGASIAADRWVGVVCEAAPNTPGGSGTATIWAKRKV